MPSGIVCLLFFSSLLSRASAAMDQPLAGNINVALGKGDLPTATMTHPSGASCEVVLTGAHVTSCELLQPAPTFVTWLQHQIAFSLS